MDNNLYTMPPAERVQQLLTAAQHEIKIAMCWFTNEAIFRCLLAQAQRGVKVTLLLNYDQVNFQPAGLPFQQMVAAGAHIYGFVGEELLHVKCVLTDHNYLLTGSFNWTQSRHIEHLVEISTPETIAQFEHQFKIWQQKALIWEQLIQLTPRNTYLQQLLRPGIWTVTQLRQQVVRGGKVWTANFHPNVGNHCLKNGNWYLKSTPINYWKHQAVWDIHLFNDWLTAHQPPKKALLKRFCCRVSVGDVVIARTTEGKVIGLGCVGSEPEPMANNGVQRRVYWLPWPEHAKYPEELPQKAPILSPYRGSALRWIAAFQA
jgi:PLD-like domain